MASPIITDLLMYSVMLMPEGKLFLLAVPKALTLYYWRNGSIICQAMKTQNIQTEMTTNRVRLKQEINCRNGGGTQIIMADQ